MEGDDPLVTQCRARVGRLIGGKWRLDALIGVGGMAAVYMATHRNGSMAALKILHEDVARNTEVRERFLREAYIANKVNHPGTVRVLDDDKDESGAPYIVMELLRGQSIEGKAEKAGGRLSISETLEILDQTLAVLESAHAQTIVHRDLKPENLFWTDQGQVKVLDFGIARLREENSRKTQTGLVMGTPAFMAPEQAMGRWNDVDARTDLWAMGATAFTLLTGLPVHEAETAGEMLVAAATRPARSLARVMNGAPFALVALVDRALAYERDQRYPDAVTFRKELAKIRGSVSDQQQGKSNRPAAPLMPATVVGVDAAAPLLAGAPSPEDEAERVETYDPSDNTDQEIANMQKCFGALQHALVATRQYGTEHPEAKRRFDEAFREFASALMTCEVALAWNLTPYSFTARDVAVWEPDSPFNRIPYHFFSDGVRMMGLAPGLDEQEFKTWLKLLLIDPMTEMSPDDDLVTMLWDASFDHLFFQAVDTFAEGNQDQRARYEADRAQVLAGAQKDHRIGLSEAMTEKPDKRGGSKNNALEKSRELFKLLARGDATDAEAAARVANLNVLEESPDELEAARQLALDDNAVALLAARMEIDVAATSERFVVAAAEAFVASAKTGRSQAVTAPLRRAVDSLGSGSPAKAIDMILELRDAVSVDGNEVETNSLRETITSEVLSAPTLLEVLRGSKKLTEDAKAEYLRSMSKVLGCIQAQHFDSALEFLPEAPDGPVQELLLEFIGRIGRGNEAKIGTLFPKLKVELALAMVRLLNSIDTPAAKEAISMAANSPHALVRIEALGYVEGAAGPRLRAEMKRLLEDEDGEVRLATLRAMEANNIQISGPFLVLRIQEREFSKLPLDERRQALQTLSKLRAKRCEEVCIALLKDEKLLRSNASEETRELAAGFLAEVASTDGAFFMLDQIAKSSILRNSKRVRDAAASALQRLKERAEEAEKRRAERRTGAGAKRSKSGVSSVVEEPATKTGANSPARNPSTAGKTPSVTTGKSPSTAGAPKQPAPKTASVAGNKTPSVAENDNKSATKSGSQSKGGGESVPPRNREAQGQ
ncbi:MAG TPA: protein kinase [Polyangiales bacterium]|nr:protein kinase [Polyangiales bacterium]